MQVWDMNKFWGWFHRPRLQLLLLGCNSGVDVMPQVPGPSIQGAGGYGSYPGNLYHDRFDWIAMPDGEIRHVAATAVIGIVARNPAVSVGVGIAHGLYHLYDYMYTDTGHFAHGQQWSAPPSPGGGGPGHSLTSTKNPPMSILDAGRFLKNIN